MCIQSHWDRISLMANKLQLSPKEIDNILKTKFDLDFLLNQISGKNILFGPSVIDVLRFVPKFAKAITSIRIDLKINQSKIKDTLRRIVGVEDFDNYIVDCRNIARAIDFPLSQSWSNVNLKIEAWKVDNFPGLISRVSQLRLVTLGNAPHSWQKAIEDYILFDLISPIPALYRREGVGLEIRRDEVTNDSYIEIRIYADTNPKLLPSRRDLVWLQKSLRGYANPSDLEVKIFVSRFAQFILKNTLKLDRSSIEDWLNDKNFDVPDYEHESQEIKRFMSLFSK